MNITLERRGAGPRYAAREWPREKCNPDSLASRSPELARFFMYCFMLLFMCRLSKVIPLPVSYFSHEKNEGIGLGQHFTRSVSNTHIQNFKKWERPKKDSMSKKDWETPG